MCVCWHLELQECWSLTGGMVSVTGAATGFCGAARPTVTNATTSAKFEGIRGAHHTALVIHFSKKNSRV